MNKLAIIYIDYSPGRDFCFEKPLLKRISTEYPQFMVFDLDLGSGQLLYGYARKLIEESERVFLLIGKHGAVEQANKALFIQLMNVVRQQAPKVKAAFIGQDATVEKLLSVLNENAKTGLSEQEAFAFLSEEISSFFSDQ